MRSILILLTTTFAATVFGQVQRKQNLSAQPKADQLLTHILQSNTDSLFQTVIQHPEIYRYQIIYTQINRNKNNIPSFQNYYLNYDSLQYFNPASTVKMPLAFLSL